MHKQASKYSFIFQTYADLQFLTHSNASRNDNFCKRFNLFFFLLNITGCPQRHGKGYGFKEEQTQSQQEQHAQGSAIDEHVET